MNSHRSAFIWLIEQVLYAFQHHPTHIHTWLHNSSNDPSLWSCHVRLKQCASILHAFFSVDNNSKIYAKQTLPSYFMRVAAFIFSSCSFFFCFFFFCFFLFKLFWNKVKGCGKFNYFKTLTTTTEEKTSISFDRVEGKPWHMS